jgi:hypothetical protein
MKKLLLLAAFVLAFGVGCYRSNYCGGDFSTEWEVCVFLDEHNQSVTKEKVDEITQVIIDVIADRYPSYEGEIHWGFASTEVNLYFLKEKTEYILEVERRMAEREGRESYNIGGLTEIALVDPQINDIYVQYINVYVIWHDDMPFCLERSSLGHEMIHVLALFSEGVDWQLELGDSTEEMHPPKWFGYENGSVAEEVYRRLDETCVF